jgi:hypothetical protein
MRIRFQLFNLDADPDPESQTNADPDSGLTLPSLNGEFLREKNIKVLYVINRYVIKHTYVGTSYPTKTFVKGYKSGLFVNFCQFTCPGIRIRIPNTEPDLDPGEPNRMLIHGAPDPDPQHWVKPMMNLICDIMVWTQNWKVPCLLKKDAIGGQERSYKH